MTWRITGSLTPRPDGGFDVDVEATRATTRGQASRAKVTAPTDESLTAEVDALRVELGPALSRLADQMAQVQARQNKRGEVAVSRTLREIYRPLVSAMEKYEPEALCFGMQEAVTREIPNVNYAKKAATGWEPVATPTTPTGMSRYDVVGRTTDDA